jgi:hypothetical protein
VITAIRATDPVRFETPYAKLTFSSSLAAELHSVVLNMLHIIHWLIMQLMDRNLQIMDKVAIN